MTQSICARELVNISVSVLQIPEPAAPIQTRITNKRIWTIVDSELEAVYVPSGALFHSSYRCIEPYREAEELFSIACHMKR